MMTLIDTNVILRYLLNDIAEQADEAVAVIDAGAFTLPEIVAEVVYVLTKLYNVPRAKIHGIVAPIFDEVAVEHHGVIRTALARYSETKFDFVDCLILARKELLGEDVFTFDKKLRNRLTGAL